MLSALAVPVISPLSNINPKSDESFLLVPVMPHQAEDIWQNMPENQKCGLESVLLTDWPAVNDKWNNPELETEFSEILKLREIVTKAIEPMRAEKKIGSSLETAVYIVSDNAKALEKYEKELCNIFITSQAYFVNEKPADVMNEHSEEGYTVYVTKAQGEKCERCWKYRPLGNHAGYETICDDCYNAVTGQD